jgi:hypothetical protein
LLSTIPLDITLRWLGHDDIASKLVYSSTHIIGLGLRGLNPHDNKCWLYYPEDDCPYYRCTVFSHYGIGNVPVEAALLPTLRLGGGGGGEGGSKDSEARPGPYWSLMFEVSESPVKPVNIETIVEVFPYINVFVSLTHSLTHSLTRSPFKVFSFF